MASKPRRRRSKELPPDLSELMGQLKNHSASFIREFDNNEDRMRQIKGELEETTAEVRKMQKRLAARIRAIILAGLVVAAALAVTAAVTVADGGARKASTTLTATPIATRTATRMRLAPAVEQEGVLAGKGAAGILPMTVVAAAVALVAAIGGVVYANVRQRIHENRSIKKVEELGKEFMEMVEPLKKDLEEIKRMCEKLEQRSAEDQAGNTLADMEELQRSLRRVSEDRREREILANMCQKVVDDCEKMKEELKNFTEQLHRGEDSDSD
ncbi:uncharacterized protein LOC120545308 isoform X1 [Perca fluviatilis]|uniref:uncharacterized protein LOC120545308 isoform X1 n=1 Tax=Perca fluviatilis TaxID=8168 RepID=UPI0019629559|nr:uncharacterized protein LOC120545308 isoform X1 [Perca fluviatilis]XP_039635485.1 uncharacterized protein LOC120545308 isoform X1 [Perca fluviatilis]